jgi:hypothetical protein
MGHISRGPGVYIFARPFSRTLALVYFGQASKLRNRIEQQLKSVPLMMGLTHAPVGRRILPIGRLKPCRGQQAAKVLDISQSGLIEGAPAGGHDVLNQPGTATKVHAIKSKGNTASREIVPLAMYVGR